MEIDPNGSIQDLLKEGGEGAEEAMSGLGGMGGMMQDLAFSVGLILFYLFLRFLSIFFGIFWSGGGEFRQGVDSIHLFPVRNIIDPRR